QPRLNHRLRDDRPAVGEKLVHPVSFPPQVKRVDERLFIHPPGGPAASVGDSCGSAAPERHHVVAVPRLRCSAALPPSAKAVFGKELRRLAYRTFTIADAVFRASASAVRVGLAEPIRGNNAGPAT